MAADHDGACSGSPFEKETGWCSHSAHWQRKNPPWWKPAFHEGCHGSAAACADEVHGKPPAPARERANYVAAPAYFNLNQACVVVNRALNPFGGFGCYLVGSSLYRKDHRDVDVRFLMSDEGYDRMFRTQVPSGPLFLFRPCGWAAFLDRRGLCLEDRGVFTGDVLRATTTTEHVKLPVSDVDDRVVVNVDDSSLRGLEEAAPDDELRLLAFRDGRDEDLHLGPASTTDDLDVSHRFLDVQVGSDEPDVTDVNAFQWDSCLDGHSAWHEYEFRSSVDERAMSEAAVFTADDGPLHDFLHR